MKSPTFLDLPIDVREHIYTELLVLPAAREGSYAFRSNSVTTGILFVNRQIYRESSNIFYSKNLFILVRMDTGTENLFPYLSLKPPILARFVPCRIVDPIAQAYSHSRFAMSFNIVQTCYRRRAPAAFVVPAQALHLLLYEMKQALAYPAILSSAIDVQIHNTFRYTVARFSELIFGSVLSMQRLPLLQGLRIRGPLEPDYHRRLMSMLVDKQMEAHWERRSWRWCLDQRHTSHLNRVTLRTSLSLIDIIWDFVALTSYPSMGAALTEFTVSVSEFYRYLIITYLFEARGRPSRAASSLLVARNLVEEAISYLRRDDRFVGSETLRELSSSRADARRYQFMIGNARGLLSLQASMICSKLGDFDAARSYKSDAYRQRTKIVPCSVVFDRHWDWGSLPDPGEPSEVHVGSPVLWDEEHIQIPPTLDMQITKSLDEKDLLYFGQYWAGLEHLEADPAPTLCTSMDA